jgi:hypothetical protein
VGVAYPFLTYTKFFGSIGFANVSLFVVLFFSYFAGVLFGYMESFQGVSILV